MSGRGSFCPVMDDGDELFADVVYTLYLAESPKNREALRLAADRFLGSLAFSFRTKVGTRGLYLTIAKLKANDPSLLRA